MSSSPPNQCKPQVSSMLTGNKHLTNHGQPVIGKSWTGVGKCTAKTWSRFLVCVLLSLGFPVALACWIVRTSIGYNIKPSMFKDTDWYERFTKDPLSVLHNAEHTRKRKQMVGMGFYRYY